MNATRLRLPTAHPVESAPIDLDSLDRWELQVTLFAAGCRWATHRNRSHADLARLLVDQINTLGLPTVREIASRVRTAVETCQWHEWAALLPGDDARADANALAVKFQRYQRRGSTLGAWHQHLTTTTTSVVAA